MNWRRGLLRLWLVASLCWAAFIGWSAYQESMALSAQHACWESKKDNPGAGNPFDCFDARIGLFEDLVPVETRIARYAVLLIIPILIPLVLGFAVAWVLAGFARDPGKAA
jgi:hypothetical protein